MINYEVIHMEKENINQVQPAEEQSAPAPYTPRPLWRAVCAWIGLALFIAAVVGMYLYLKQGIA